ncbi:MAG TPA: nucleotidyltransferase domain-containing protein [Candidatus Nanoarchaeia archaeon]|nr:nucleotidyltransferase domain-containing protein [Candidatus Nanoarchaeia archaeon]
MEFRIQRKENENLHKYPTANLEIASKFAQQAKKELGDFVLTIAVFGSSARRETSINSDIDVLVITDDATYVLTEELVEGYKIIIDNLISRISLKLHITSMTFTSFWEHAKVGDPVVVNILRDGVALDDKGFFFPLQILLKQGRIRPTEESVWRYFSRAPRTLVNSRWHVLQATLDLYWAVIDSAHAALMRAHEIPPAPEHVADLLEKAYVKKKLLESKYIDTMNKFYHLMKQITHRELQYVGGHEFERLHQEADAFVRRMRKLIEVRSY